MASGGLAGGSTSRKHRHFVNEPVGSKDITELAGIGPTLGKRLGEKGFDKAIQVLGRFLELKKNEESFKDWLKDICGANSKQQQDCFTCLNEWCKASI